MWIAQLRELLDGHRPVHIPPEERTVSAVVVPLSVKDGALHATFIQRTEMVHHPGQISFPGGRVERRDADLYAAALREMEEEIGVAPKLALPVGELSDQITPTGYWIRPFVAAIPHQAVFATRDAGEVQDAFALPLLELNIVQGQWGAEFHYGGKRVWGVTARILGELLEVMGRAF
jgi:8-oxo-dGTP pyrophosphatase MutT (NUDIX family)